MTNLQSKESSNAIETLTADLTRQDPVARTHAREALVAIGTPEVTAALVAALTDPRPRVRWEAAKALDSLADPVSAPALVQALEDDNDDVRWLAADGLTAMGTDGLTAMLNALVKRASSYDFCRSAHQILSRTRDRYLREVAEPVLRALEEHEPGVSVPLAAHEALVLLKVVPRPNPRPK